MKKHLHWVIVKKKNQKNKNKPIVKYLQTKLPMLKIKIYNRKTEIKIISGKTVSIDAILSYPDY